MLIEWPEAESVPTKYYRSTLKQQTSLRKLVYAAKGRWPIERDYEELQDIGLGHWTGRVIGQNPAVAPLIARSCS